MNKFRILAMAFIVTAILLSDIMCAHVAFEYCNMLRGISSAPPNIAFLLTIPYVVGILICIILSYILWRKSNQ